MSWPNEAWLPPSKGDGGGEHRPAAHGGGARSVPSPGSPAPIAYPGEFVADLEQSSKVQPLAAAIGARPMSRGLPGRATAQGLA